MGLILACSVSVAQTDDDRRAKQAELDAACEAARQQAIAAAKAEYIEECVEKEMRPDRAACERFYANYGERAGNRPPLFYDLDACVVAQEFRTSYRSTNSCVVAQEFRTSYRSTN